MVLCKPSLASLAGQYSIHHEVDLDLGQLLVQGSHQCN